MDNFAIRAILEATQHCAEVMLENATYILDELENLIMSSDFQQQIARVCNILLSTQLDIVSELFALDEISDQEGDSDLYKDRIDRIISWIRSDLDQLHKLVKTLEGKAMQDTQWIWTYILVAESAKNILDAFNLMQTARQSLPDGKSLYE